MRTAEITQHSEIVLPKSWARKALPFPGERGFKFKTTKKSKAISACLEGIASAERGKQVPRVGHWKKAKKHLEKEQLNSKSSFSILWSAAYSTSPEGRRGLIDWHLEELGAPTTVELVLDALPGLEDDQLKFDWRWESDYLFQLRRHLCNISEDEYQQCLQKAEERLGVSRRVYGRSVFLFPGQTEWIKNYPHPQNFLETSWMLASVVDRQTAEKIVPDATLGSFRLVDQDLLGTFVKGLGALSAPYLVGVIPDKLDATDAKLMARALGSIKSEVSLEKLLELEPQSKHIRPGLEHLLESFPLWALGYLCRARKEDGWIRYLVRQNPGIVDKLESPERNYLDKVLGKAAGGGVLPDYLKEASSGSVLPSWFDVAALESPRLKEGKSLSPQAMEALARCLMESDLERTSAEVIRSLEQCEVGSLAAFSWTLFEQWLQSGGSTKDEWAFLSLGILGDDEVVGRLAALLSKWPGESHSARAVKGLAILDTIGSPLAHMHLYNFSQQTRYSALGEKAQELIETLAASRGLSLDELADRLVPTLGLQADGFLHLDFGPRQFRLGFDEKLEPFVLSSGGKPLKSLPKVGKRDDKDKADRARRLFKTTKSQSRVLAKQQLHRLEKAMCHQRRWKSVDFQEHLVQHPLLFPIVRRLVWGTFQDGELVRSFRVAEDRTQADLQDTLVSLLETEQVGLLHPLEMNEAEVESWKEIFSDYQLLQPLEQLERETFLADDEELSRSAWDGVYDDQIESTQILGLLARDWSRGLVRDGGVFCWVAKEVDPGLRAFLSFEPGIDPVEPRRNPRVDLESLVLGEEDGLGNPVATTPFSEISAVLFSELQRDLKSLL